jgi:hypothetical protein
MACLYPKPDKVTRIPRYSVRHMAEIRYYVYFSARQCIATISQRKTEPTGSTTSCGSENTVIVKSLKQNVGSFSNVTQFLSLHILALIASTVFLFAKSYIL